MENKLQQRKRGALEAQRRVLLFLGSPINRVFKVIGTTMAGVAITQAIHLLSLLHQHRGEGFEMSWFGNIDDWLFVVCAWAIPLSWIFALAVGKYCDDKFAYAKAKLDATESALREKVAALESKLSAALKDIGKSNEGEGVLESIRLILTQDHAPGRQQQLLNVFLGQRIKTQISFHNLVPSPIDKGYIQGWHKTGMAVLSKVGDTPTIQYLDLKPGDLITVEGTIDLIMPQHGSGAVSLS